MDIMEHFGERVKEARNKMKWTQAKLASEIGVSTQTISAYENSTGVEKGKTPTLDRAALLAEKLGVSLDYLCGTETCARTCEIDTLADVVQCIYEISRVIKSSNGVTRIQLDPVDCYEVPDGQGGTEFVTSENAATFTMENSILAFHFDSMNKVEKLYNDGVIDRDLYNTILTGEIEKLRKYSLRKGAWWSPEYQINDTVDQ